MNVVSAASLEKAENNLQSAILRNELVTQVVLLIDQTSMESPCRSADKTHDLKIIKLQSVETQPALDIEG